MSLIFSNLVVIKTLKFKPSYVQPLQKFVKMPRYAKQFSQKISSIIRVMFHVVVYPKFSVWKWWRYPDSETENIDSEKWLFDYKLQEYKDNIPSQTSETVQ